MIKTGFCIEGLQKTVSQLERTVQNSETDRASTQRTQVIEVVLRFYFGSNKQTTNKLFPSTVSLVTCYFSSGLDGSGARENERRLKEAGCHYASFA